MDLTEKQQAALDAIHAQPGGYITTIGEDDVVTVTDTHGAVTTVAPDGTVSPA